MQYRYFTFLQEPPIMESDRRTTDMNPFIYHMPVKVYFGENGVQKHLQKELANYGQTVLLVYGGGSVKRNGIYDEVVSELLSAGKRIVELSGVASNPTYEKILEGIALYKKENADLILGVGGGSVADTVKIIAAGAKTEEDLWNMEINEKRRPEKMGRYAVILTISGAGAEMDHLGACTYEALHLKQTFVGPYADFVIEDPRYLMSIPLKTFLPGVFDSLSHCMESYFGAGFNVWDEMNESLMRNIIANARALLKDPDNMEIRSNLMWDSSLIQSFSFYMGKPGDFNVHHIENTLCAYTHRTHGIELGIMHPVYYRMICHGDEAKFARFAVEVMGVPNTGTQAEKAEAGVDALAAFIKELGLPTTFAEAGIEIDEALARTVTEKTVLTTTNVYNISKEDVYTILCECR